MNQGATWVCLAAAVTLSLASAAMAEPETGSIAPLPEVAGEEAPTRITPADNTAADAILTTHKPESNLGAVPAKSPFGTYQPKMPFGHASPAPAVIPSAPHTAEAVPVGDVDAVETSEPAPPTPVEPAADPAKEDPAAPTEFTSPIFAADANPAMPRRITIRALNKVTAQSETLELKPNQTASFGQLEITAITCRISEPSSQYDMAGLLDVAERVPTKEGKKPLFRGWMYASSPSITSLEHPVYDVTMVACAMGAAAPKPEEKPVAPEGKAAKKPASKARR